MFMSEEAELDRIPVVSAMRLATPSALLPSVPLTRLEPVLSNSSVALPPPSDPPNLFIIELTLLEDKRSIK
jgi:hypothetical protein